MTYALESKNFDIFRSDRIKHLISLESLDILFENEAHQGNVVFVTLRALLFVKIVGGHISVIGACEFDRFYHHMFKAGTHFQIF